jgi:hypothetical protein
MVRGVSLTHKREALMGHNNEKGRNNQKSTQEREERTSFYANTPTSTTKNRTPGKTSSPKQAAKRKRPVQITAPDKKRS